MFRNAYRVACDVVRVTMARRIALESLVDGLEELSVIWYLLGVYVTKSNAVCNMVSSLSRLLINTYNLRYVIDREAETSRSYTSSLYQDYLITRNSDVTRNKSSVL
jgi:hypothetical protein